MTPTNFEIPFYWEFLEVSYNDRQKEREDDKVTEYCYIISRFLRDMSKEAEDCRTLDRSIERWVRSNLSTLNINGNSKR